MRVQEALEQLRSAAEALAAEHPDLAADERAWIDTLSGITDGIDLAGWLAERCLQLGSLEDAAIERAKTLQARAKRFAAEQERLRGVILALVDAAGGKKVVLPGVTLSPRNTPRKLVATNEAETPPEFLVRVESYKPDKELIKEALEYGQIVDGWQLTNGGRTVALLTR